MLALVPLVALSFGLLQQTHPPETVIPAQDLGPTKSGSYNWWERHDAVVNRVKQGHVDLLLIGDSITHGWGGPPDAYSYGGPGGLYEKYFGGRNAVNLGFGWDRTQHVLWRFNHGELDGISPKVATLMIGTNNIGVNTSSEIAAGVTAIVDQLQSRLPRTKILLLAIFPRDHEPDSRNRKQVAEVNALITPLGKRPGVVFLDLTDKFLEPDGTLSKDMMGDFLHPTPKGYEVWARSMEPTLAKMLGEQPRI
jgi:lysophospholipase L1-like esterase